MTVLADLFINAVELSGVQRLLLMLPLCLSVAVVYKTIRTENMKEVLLSSLILWGTIVLGMYAVGVGLWIFYSLLA